MNISGNAKTAAAALALLLLGSCSDTWDDHYASTSPQGSDKTLWEEIENDPRLAAFANYLKSTGYDEKLNTSQMYTVWAPMGEIEEMQGKEKEQIEKDLVQNHIARFAYSAFPGVDQNVTLLNKKIINFSDAGGDAYTYGSVKLDEKNIIAKNGVLHIIDSPAEYFSNLWEYLDRDERLDSIKKFMYSFTEEEFDEYHSVESGVVDGMTVYSDSVMIESNLLWNRIGALNDEDSAYIFLAPSNKAWNDAYDRVSRYFVFDSKVAGRDSLQQHYTKLAIVNDLVFSNSMQESMADSLVSTRKNVFENPKDYIFADFPGYLTGQGAYRCSNGYIYVTDTLRHKAADSWQQKIKVEAENTNARNTFTGCAIYTRDVDGGASNPYYNKVSRNQYVEMVPSNSSVNPSVTYDIPNTLSAAYDVYCVFVPPYVANLNTKTAKPSIVRFTLTHHNETGSLSYINTSDTVFKRGLTQIDTVLVAENYKFPVANYQQDETTVTLKIATNVSRTQTTVYTRQLLIDCIILKPHE